MSLDFVYIAVCNVFIILHLLFKYITDVMKHHNKMLHWSYVAKYNWCDYTLQSAH